MKRSKAFVCYRGSIIFLSACVCIVDSVLKLSALYLEVLSGRTVINQGNDQTVYMRSLILVIAVRSGV